MRVGRLGNYTKYTMMYSEMRIHKSSTISLPVAFLCFGEPGGVALLQT